MPWGLWVAAYIYFIGLSAGSFLISSLVYVFNMKRFERIGRLAVFTAVVTLFLALLSIWADLGHMGRAWEVLVYANFKSPMAWMIWLYSRLPAVCSSSSCGSSSGPTWWRGSGRRACKGAALPGAVARLPGPVRGGRGP